MLLFVDFFWGNKWNQIPYWVKTNPNKSISNLPEELQSKSFWLGTILSIPFGVIKNSICNWQVHKSYRATLLGLRHPQACLLNVGLFIYTQEDQETRGRGRQPDAGYQINDLDRPIKTYHLSSITMLCLKQTNKKCAAFSVACVTV